MSRTNPLFVDSTKLYGETIATQFELEGLLLRDDEKVSAKIIRKNGEEMIIPMRLIDNGNYEGRTWLGHQESFNLQFFVTVGPNVVLSSRPKRMVATYVISEKWQPNLESPKEEKKDAIKNVSRWKDSLVFDWLNE